MLGHRDRGRRSSPADSVDGLGLLPVNTTFDAREAPAPGQRGTVLGRRRRAATRSATAASTATSRCSQTRRTSSAPPGTACSRATRSAASCSAGSRRAPGRDWTPGHARVRRRARSAPRPARRLVRRARRRNPHCIELIERGRPGWAAHDPARRHRVLRLLTTADTEILAAAHAVAAARRRLPRGPLRRTRRTSTTSRRSSRARASSSSACSAAAARGRRAWRRCARCCERDGIALILLGGEAEPGRRARAALAGPRGRGRAGLRVPAPRRRREHARAAALPGRHVRAHRPRLRAAAASSATSASTRREPRAATAARASASSSTARTSRPATRRSSTRWPPRSRTPAASPSALWAYSLRGDAPALKLLDGKVDALITTVLAQRRLARRRRVARGGARGARRPGHPGAVRDDLAAALGGVGLRPDAARRRDAGRDPRVRRAHHRRADLLQGAARGLAVRGAALRARRRALRPARAASPSTTRGCGRSTARAAHRDRALLLPDQARAGRQRGRARHARQRDGAAGRRCKRGRPPRRARLRRRRRAHPRADRRRRPRPGVPVRHAAAARPPRGCRSPSTSSGSRRCRPSCASRWSRRGARRPASSTSTATTS